MAKRGADKELTQDNWDQEEDEEEVFSLFYIFMFFNIPHSYVSVRFVLVARGPVTNVHLLPAWRAITLTTKERQITKVRSCYLNVVI